MDEEGYRYTDKIQFYVMDLKAVAEASEEERKRGLVEWAEAFSARDWNQLQKINNPGVKEAAKEMEAVMSSPEKRQFVWNRRLAQLDYNAQIDSARILEAVSIYRDEMKMDNNSIISRIMERFMLQRKDAEKYVLVTTKS